ncbi:MAG: hypothetical protein BGO69_11940 [Bacteroidetes bacterium 46-16]|nr:MAG: hypothetical protein BGO69_11940 [Bacteroidetes bacterium 46-16]
MNITVYSRSNEDALFEQMKAFIPAGIKVLKCEQFHDWQHAADYLHYIIDYAETDWIANIDIDCFVFDWPGFTRLLEYLQQNGYDYCGMPDGGVHPGRSWSWCTMNPFFNIFNAAKIKAMRQVHGLSWEVIGKEGYRPEFEERRPAMIKGPYNHIAGEPFHGFFFWLFRMAKGYFMNARILDDELTTYLHGIDGEDIILHTWYSRLYSSDKRTKLRIDRYLKEAQNKKALCKL